MHALTGGNSGGHGTRAALCVCVPRFGRWKQTLQVGGGCARLRFQPYLVRLSGKGADVGRFVVGSCLPACLPGRVQVFPYGIRKESTVLGDTYLDLARRRARPGPLISPFRPVHVATPCPSSSRAQQPSLARAWERRFVYPTPPPQVRAPGPTVTQGRRRVPQS